MLAKIMISYHVSTHSRAEAAARSGRSETKIIVVSTHSRAEAAAYDLISFDQIYLFQHTAARRRLQSKRLE